jgi:hypothetical protein
VLIQVSVSKPDIGPTGTAGEIVMDFTAGSPELTGGGVGQSAEWSGNPRDVEPAYPAADAIL